MPTVTYEGENTILLLQTARYLLKALMNLKQGKTVTSDVEYLKALPQVLKEKSGKPNSLTKSDKLSERRALH